MPDLPIPPARVWIVLSPQGKIVHAQPHEPHPADARMWASHGATVAEYPLAPAPEPPDRPLAPCLYCCCSPCTCEGGVVSSLPIAPDESSGEPRCSRECPSWGSTDAVRYGHCAHPEQGTQRVIGDLCHPRVRELVALSRRRCDGCRHTDDERVCPSLPTLPRGLAPHESCSRWEAKR